MSNKRTSVILFLLIAACYFGVTIPWGYRVERANHSALASYLNRSGAEPGYDVTFTELEATSPYYVYTSSPPALQNGSPVTQWEITLVDLSPGRFYRLVKPLEAEEYI